MKVVISRGYGGFSPLGKYWKLMRDCYNDRSNSTLVEKVEKYPEEFEGLQIAHIPEEATDYTIVEFDGFEIVYYVVDGKIYRTTK
jgi:hypothetical protein